MRSREQVLAATYHRLRDLFITLGYDDPIGCALQLVNRLRDGTDITYDVKAEWKVVRLTVYHREHREVRALL